MKSGRVIKVSGPLVVATGMENANVYDVVEVSKNKIIGEIIEMRGGGCFHPGIRRNDWYRCRR